MPVLPAILTPDTDHHGILRQTAMPVLNFNQELLQQVSMLHDILQRTIHQLGFGRAMAAPQAGIGKRIIVMNLGGSEISLPVTLINPEIIWRSDATQWVWDDCLSTPDVLVRIERHLSVSLRFQDINGEFQEWLNLPADLAELIQHEYEHLDGVLMIDHNNQQTGEASNIKANDLSHLADRPQQHRLSLSTIATAGERINDEFTQTPLVRNAALNQLLNMNLWLKDETANAIRCFKGRGADHFLAQFNPQTEAQFVCASAGNWGLALAWSCRERGFKLTVFVAENANQVKVAKIREQGAEIVMQGHDFDGAKLAAKRYAKQLAETTEQVHFLEDGNQGAITEGAGSIGVELTGCDVHFDAILIPVGNGALINGIARWVKAASPMTQIIGVVPQGADSMYQSWLQGKVVNRERVDTCAEGLAVRLPIPEAVSDMTGLIDHMVLVSESHIHQAQHLYETHANLALEPCGSVALAGLLAIQEQAESGKAHDHAMAELQHQLTNRNVALLLTGANRKE